MKFCLCLALATLLAASGAAAQTPRATPPPSSTSPEALAQAYEQFLMGHHLEDRDDIPGAIAAYKKAMELAPSAAEIPAELAALYMRQNRIDEAVTTAEQALAIASENQEAHRVLGLIAAARADSRRLPQGVTDENLRRAIDHLERAIVNPIGEPDPNVRGTLARLYLRVNDHEKAVPVLVELVRQQPGWTEGPRLLAQAYAGAGRLEDAISLLDAAAADDPGLLPTLADYYERQRRWKDAAETYARALSVLPRNAELTTRYAQALLNAGGREDLTRAREALDELVLVRNDPRALYMLSQANRRLGDLQSAEAVARRLIGVQESSPWGYYALAAALEAGREHERLIEAITPAVDRFRKLDGDRSLELGMLLPYLGFAHQALGQFDRAIATFEEARRVAPKDPVVAGYLIGANVAAKRYPDALSLAAKARAEHPGDLTLARLQAEALRHSGDADAGIAVLEQMLKARSDDPDAYIALAQIYTDADRGARAVQLLREAQGRFPSSTAILFELGAVFEKQSNYAEAESAFRQVLARESDHAAALNYLGYMLADRGVRLEESVGYLKRAVAMEPNNGAFLDSLGWAYYKGGQYELAEPNLERAAGQLPMNSVIQEHYGDLLNARGRFEEAIAAWNRALEGDGERIDRDGLNQKIRDARRKLGR
jgi:tetratricopeptide (TPR) repeat protein